MKAKIIKLADPVDQLCQIRDELRVIWLALGNTEDADGYQVAVREHVHGLANRVGSVVDELQGGAS